ncbi:hypothetical protein [Streptomyces xanthophaeus]
MDFQSCRVGKDSLEALARIASEGVQSPSVRFRFVADGTAFEEDDLDLLISSIQASSVVANLSDCENFQISVYAVTARVDYYAMVTLVGPALRLSVTGADRTLVLGKFENLRGYLAGCGGVEAEPFARVVRKANYLGVGSPVA